MVTKFQTAVHSLLKSEPFFAHFVLNSKILYDAFNVKTAAASVVDGAPLLIFSREFMGRLNVQELQEVIKHEIMHLLLDHINTGKDENKHPLVANIAMDCAINQYLKAEQLPKDAVSLEWLRSTTKKNLEAFQTSDYYYNQIMNSQMVQKVCGGGKNTVDDHDLDIPGKESDKLAQGAVQRAAKEAAKASAGVVPEHIAKIIGSFGEPQISWKQILRNFILKRVAKTSRITQSKLNRRLPLPAPGRKHKRTLTLGVCLDSSGSVSDEQYAAFFTEVRAISRQIDKTYLVHADCVVQHVEEITKKGRLDPVRKGGGGTAYQPAIDECVKLGCDVIVYFGDFDTSDSPKDPRRPFLWVGVTNQAPPASFGKVLRIK